MRQPKPREGAGVAILLAILAVAGLGGVALALPIYRHLQAERAAAVPLGAPRVVTVAFVTASVPGFAWRARPVQARQRVAIGDLALTAIEATNPTDAPLVGHVTLAVSPAAAAVWFHKVDCLCLAEQRLAPRQSVRVPLAYYFDPAFADDPATAAITHIGLAYTFSPSRAPEKAIRLVNGGAAPDPAYGAHLFANQCAACHALNRNGVGPALANLVGRPAASEPGYTYSAALAAARVNWTTDQLDHWLVDPQAVAPGTKMPLSVTTPVTRRDIIAYLADPS